MAVVPVLLGLTILTHTALAKYTIALTRNNGIRITNGNDTIVENIAILSGYQNTTVAPLNATQGLTYDFLTPTIAKVQLNASLPFNGARFSTFTDAHFYGVWEYPFDNHISNKNVSFTLKGVGNDIGINWSNARAPFFLTSAGYGVYADTLQMGSYDFTRPGEAQFIFNTSNLVYYIILPSTENDFKSIIEQYTSVSARSEMPPTSGLGPTFWSDDFTQDFHGNVSNAQENIYDVFDHLYYNQIRATSTFLDRPYGTGNQSWGNFDFDPEFYPAPEAFIANLSSYGIDLQVWIANRGQQGTQLYNKSLSEGWLIDSPEQPLGGLGPAQNLSIPAAYDYFEKRLEYFPSVGVTGYKIDRGEEGEIPDWDQNVQMSLFIKMAYDTMVQKWGPSKFYNFARSAVDRSRQYTHVWNGDSASNFTGLAYSVASGIRAGLVAFPIWGSDTGGYTRKGVLTPTEEVWARWMWFSAFSPVYELMLGTNHTPWYPPYTQKTVDVLKQTANLHADLTPYIKSYAYHAHKTGVPIIRALFLEANQDVKTWLTQDQYFFGEQFLVAPIVQEGGTRSVYFPTGPSEKYLEYFNKTSAYQAGATANVSAGWDSMPVYVKQGAIVPRGDIFQGNAKWVEDWQPFLSIELFPSWDVKESTFEYFDGEGSEGAVVHITMTTDKANGTLRVDYEGLGVEAEVVWYLKGREKRVNLNRPGGFTTLRDVDLLF